MPNKAKTSSQQGWEQRPPVLLPASTIPSQCSASGQAANTPASLGRCLLAIGRRGATGTPAPPGHPCRVLRGQQPRLLHTAPKRGTYHSLPTPLVDGSTQGRGNDEGSASTAAARALRLARPSSQTGLWAQPCTWHVVPRPHHEMHQLFSSQNRKKTPTATPRAKAERWAPGALKGHEQRCSHTQLQRTDDTPPCSDGREGYWGQQADPVRASLG